ncbi:MAG TPA: GlxA family transcriptional regulator [Terriglobales bacterium]|jgi:transcriptional regulator GlxA family with amidase domain
MTPKHIVIVGYDDITSLDLSGPLEAFSSAHVEDSRGNPQPCYRVTIAALGAKTFRSESGLRMTATCFLSSLRHLDTLLIPGGRAMRTTPANLKLASWISRRVNHARRVASVCTGIYALAPTGLLNGRRVTTHWKFAADVAARFPELKVDANALYIRDGKFYTSAGVTAGIDLSLALIEEDFGPQVALAVARELVVYVKRPGGQEQFSEPLKFQVASTSRFADLAAWMVGHLDRDLSVDVLAERINLCPRQFSRRFREEFKSTPAAFVQRLRLDEARKRLSAAGATVESVADSVGFHDPDSFRRAFVQRFGVAPQHYRGRFLADTRS